MRPLKEINFIFLEAAMDIAEYRRIPSLDRAYRFSRPSTTFIYRVAYGAMLTETGFGIKTYMAFILKRRRGGFSYLPLCSCYDFDFQQITLQRTLYYNARARHHVSVLIVALITLAIFSGYSC